jgi:hypothetical protein
LEWVIGGRRLEYSLPRWASLFVRITPVYWCGYSDWDAGGDRFEDRMDQEALLNVLIETEKNHARPTAAIQLQMKKVWGWIPEG